MQKHPNIEPPEIEEKQKTQGKRKRRETLCKDKCKEYFHCGICGSEDLVYTQLVYCEQCGKENYDIDIKRKILTIIAESPCSCKGKPYVYRNKTYYCNPRGDITIRICSACGSVESNTCPVCKSYSKCWTSPFGEKYCRLCGYRHKGYRK
jgi:hypothetical protein